MFKELKAKKIIEMICTRDHLGNNIWLMGSQSIKKSNVVLYIVLLRISKWPKLYYFTNKLRKIQPQNFGKTKNSQFELQFYWFL